MSALNEFLEDERIKLAFFTHAQLHMRGHNVNWRKKTTGADQITAFAIFDSHYELI